MMRLRPIQFLSVGALLMASAACSDTSDPESQPWTGQTYLLDVPSTRWSDPPEIGTEIGAYVPQFVLDVQSVEGSQLDVVVGTANNGQQQMCNPTTHLQGSSSAAPQVQIGPGDFPIYLRNDEDDVTVNATVRNLTFTNVLPDGETPAEEGELSAVMDVRELYPMFVLLMSPTPDSVCNAMQSYGGCESCPHDGAAYCLTIKATYLGATRLADDFTLAPVDAAAVDVSCQNTPTN